MKPAGENARLQHRRTVPQALPVWDPGPDPVDNVVRFFDARPLSAGWAKPRPGAAMAKAGRSGFCPLDKVIRFFDARPLSVGWAKPGPDAAMVKAGRSGFCLPFDELEHATDLVKKEERWR